MRLLFFDTETTGLDTKTDDILELAVCSYDTVSKRSYAAASFIFKTNKEIPKEVEELHGLSKDLLDREGFTPGEWIPRNAGVLFSSPYFVVAHNARAFDVPLLESWCLRNGYPLEIPKNKVLDTRTDLPREAYKISCKSQAHLLAEKGIANPFPHNAMSDVMALIRLFEFYDFSEIEKIAHSPTKKLVALTSFEEKELPKAAGFSWVGNKKHWFKEIKEIYLEDELRKINFKYNTVE